MNDKPPVFSQTFGKTLEKYYVPLALLLMLLASYNFFFKLGNLPVWDWDEARYATNAYEMVQNHDYGICTYSHTVDEWNKKPFLGSWGIILGYRLFGYGVLGMRFYSALSSLLIMAMLLWLVPKVWGRAPALVAGLALPLTPPFLFSHGARMGDYCAFFCLFYVLFLICLFKAEERGPYLPLAGLCVGLGFLVYSFHAVQMLAVMGVYLILTGLYRKISIGKYLGFAAGCLLPILGWVVWRGSYPDGVKFMTESFTYDLISHTTREVEGHVGPTDYYLSYLGQHDLFLSLYFILALFLYFAVVGFKADFKNKGLTLLSLSVLIPMGLFSVARSKLGWYLDPIYPSLAVLIGWVSFRIFRDGNFRTAGKSILLFLLVVALLRSEREIWKTINFPDSKPSQNLLADLAKTHPAPGLPIWGPVWFQADQFMAEVVCQLNPLRYGNLDEVLSQKGYLMLEKDLKNQNSAFVQAHHLVVFLENDEWMLIKL